MNLKNKQKVYEINLNSIAILLLDINCNYLICTAIPSMYIFTGVLTEDISSYALSSKTNVLNCDFIARKWCKSATLFYRLINVKNTHTFLYKYRTGLFCKPNVGFFDVGCQVANNAGFT